MISLLKDLMCLYQKPEASNNEYLKKFKAQVESMSDYRACMLGKFPCLVKDEKLQKYKKTMEEVTQSEIEDFQGTVKKQLLHCSCMEQIKFGMVD